MSKTIKHQFFFPHPAEKIWGYLTNSELLELWLMKNDFQPILGFDFQFVIKPIPSLDFDGIVYCKVLEIVPFRKLSYSWKGGPGEGKITLDTVVVWRLEPTQNGTELFLEHSGFGKLENVNFYDGMNDGWVKQVQKITDHLNALQHGNSKA
jgi:uncharacterized protein YndB with AHSA1/START domain